jgi:hypothetical protein
MSSKRTWEEFVGEKGISRQQSARPAQPPRFRFGARQPRELQHVSRFLRTPCQALRALGAAILPRLVRSDLYSVPMIRHSLLPDWPTALRPRGDQGEARE